MKTKIINNLKEFYLQNRERIHLILVDQKMKDVCDTYYIDELSFRQISDTLNMSIHEVNGRMLAAVSIMIRCKEDIDDDE